LGYPCKFQLVSRLRSVTARHLVLNTSRWWTQTFTVATTITDPSQARTQDTRRSINLRHHCSSTLTGRWHALRAETDLSPVLTPSICRAKVNRSMLKYAHTPGAGAKPDKADSWKEVRPYKEELLTYLFLCRIYLLDAALRRTTVR